MMEIRHKRPGNKVYKSAFDRESAERNGSKTM